MSLYPSVLIVSAALLLSLVSVHAQDVESLADIFSTHDIARLRRIFTSAEPYDDIATPYYMLQGLKALGFEEKDKVLRENACLYTIYNLDTSSIKSLHLVSSIAAIVGNDCVEQVLAKRDEIQSVLAKGLEGETSMETLYHMVTAMANLGLEFNGENVLSSLTRVLENEESIFNSGLVFLTASRLPEGVDLSDIFEQIEDVIAQADETPTTLYYDSLETTATVISGIFAMATRMGEAPAITPEQATKFGNYLVSNKYTTNLTAAAQLLAAASALDKNDFVVPNTLLLKSPRYVSKENPNIKVRLSTILGSALPATFTVKLNTIEDPQGKETTRNKQTKREEGGVYTYNLLQDVSSPGIYTLTFSTDATAESPVVELSDARLQVTLSYLVTVGSAELSLVDREQETTSKSVSLDYPNSSTSVLDADQHLRVVMTFTLLNKETKKSVLVHQAFIRLSLGSLEIYFVATPDKKTHQYTFDLDMVSAASDFGSLSGSYSIALIVGDFALENPFFWDVVRFNQLVFPGSKAEQKEDYTYKAKPEIQHMFRPDEKLPPKVISSTFTVLALTPLAILLVLWAIIGVNLSGIGTGGIWTLFFHLGIGGILMLYYIFWVKLNMFDTFKLLALLSIPTFVAGNRMLRRIAKANKPSA